MAIASYQYPPQAIPSRLRSRDPKIIEAAIDRVGATVVYAEVITTSGGAAAEEVTISGVKAGDVVSAVLADDGDTPRAILSAVATADKVTITFDGDPSTDHDVNLLVLRAV